MNKTRLAMLAAWSLVVAAAPLGAQSGCFHSPEAPTDVLLLVGGAGMFYGSSLVTKWLGRRRAR
jgi:XrtJ-associated TM-motif-TM protein